MNETWVIARRVDALESLKAETNVTIRCIGADLCDPESFTRIGEILSAERPNVKLLPYSIVMNVWINQQKKAKNNQNLTTK